MSFRRRGVSGSGLLVGRRRRRHVALPLVCFVSLLGALGIVMLQAGEADAAPATWSITPSPNPGSASNDLLQGVSCISSTNCVAVGSSSGKTLVETWDGTKWSITPSPNEGSAGGNFLNGVSCISSTNCVAVGSSSGKTLVETWDGTKWSVTPSPNEGSAGNFLNGVSCTSSTNCVAVGDYQASPNLSQTLVETWDGTTWSITPSPNQVSPFPAPPTDNNFLNGVSCTSSTNCVAVGYYLATKFIKVGLGIQPVSHNQTLVETWDGKTWSITPTPNVGGMVNEENYLDGVSCTGPTNCVAVGDYLNTQTSLNSYFQTLVETGDGSWSITPSPNAGTGTDNGLNGVSCLSSTNCVAIGSFDNPSSGSLYTLVETWDGTKWSVTPSPNEGKEPSLSGVSCTGSSECVAVGSYVNSSNVFQTLVETNATTTRVLIPSNGASLSGSQYLDAAASNANKVEFHLTGGTFNESLIATATLTYYDWLASWNTTTVPNGSHTLQSVAYNAAGMSAHSAPVAITINNSPPSTKVLRPSNGATLSGGQYLDASASSGLNKVEFHLTGGSLNDVVIATGTPTYYGWIGGWDTTTVPSGTYTLQSVAYYAGGVSGRSAGITVTIAN